MGVSLVSFPVARPIYSGCKRWFCFSLSLNKRPSTMQRNLSWLMQNHAKDNVQHGLKELHRDAHYVHNMQKPCMQSHSGCVSLQSQRFKAHAQHDTWHEREVHGSWWTTAQQAHTLQRERFELVQQIVMQLAHFKKKNCQASYWPWHESASNIAYRKHNDSLNWAV